MNKPHFALFFVAIAMLASVSAQAQFNAHLVSDITVGSWGTKLSNLVDLNGVCMFLADDSDLYRSDGTEAGTYSIQHVTNGCKPLVVKDGFVYFMDWWGNLWRSDGTAAGTDVLVSIPDINVYWSEALIAGDHQFFMYTERGDMTAHDIWMTDGTDPGTLRVAENCSAPTAVIGDRVFYSSWTSATEAVFSVSDGTIPEALHTFTFSGSRVFPPQDGVPLGNRLLFSVGDLNGGVFLWSTDGTSAGTVMLKQTLGGTWITPEIQSLVPTGNVYHDELYFCVNGPTTCGLWKTDGTPAGTVQVKDFGAEKVSQMMGAGGVCLYVGVITKTYYTPAQLYRSDGTDAGTVVLKEASGMLPVWSGMASMGCFSAFVTYPGTLPSELWHHDGPGSTMSFVSRQNIIGANMAQVGNKFFYAANDGTHGTEVWVCDVPAAVLEPPNADFTANPSIGRPPLGVTFIDRSNLHGLTVESRLWDFGDGDVSTGAEPVHVYADEGRYTVKLTVTTSAGTDTKIIHSAVIVAAEVPSSGIAGTAALLLALCAAGWRRSARARRR